MYVCVCVCVCVSVCMHVYMYVHMYVCTCAYMHYVYITVSMYVYVCMYVCKYCERLVWPSQLGTKCSVMYHSRSYGPLSRYSPIQDRRGEWIMDAPHVWDCCQEHNRETEGCKQRMHTIWCTHNDILSYTHIHTYTITPQTHTHTYIHTIPYRFQLV